MKDKVNSMETNKPKRKSARNKNYWIEQGYDEPTAIIMARSRMPGTPEYFEIYKGYTKEKSIELSKEYNKLHAVTLENMIRKYGVPDGTKRFTVYKQKQAYTNSFEHKQKKYGWTKEQFDEFNSNRAITKKNLIRKYGEGLGLEKWESYRKRQSYAGNKLEYFIEKYGELEGIEKYRKVALLKSNTFEAYLERNNGDVELATKQFTEVINNKANKKHTSPGNSTSAVSIEFCNELHTMIDHMDHEIYHMMYNKEWCFIHINENSNPKAKVMYVDFFDRTTGKIIEFYGDYWHANPDVYADNDMLNLPEPTGKILASDLRKKDQDRLDIIKQFPYVIDIMIVWENDFRTNKQKVLEKCKNFLIGN